MTTQYFRNYSNPSEQNLIRNLTDEVINIHGMEVFYVPRRQLNTDEVMVDDKLSEFYNSYPLTVYLKNAEGFGGPGNFLTQFGLELRNQITLSISRRIFEQEVGQRDDAYRITKAYMGSVLTRPKEGDLIYLPMNEKIYQIRYVDPEAQFYPLGTLLTFDLSCEQFNFNNELYNTGNPAIDNIFDQLSINQQTPTNTPTNIMPAPAGSDAYSFTTPANTVPVWDAPFIGGANNAANAVNTTINTIQPDINTDPFGDNIKR